MKGAAAGVRSERTRAVWKEGRIESPYIVFVFSTSLSSPRERPCVDDYARNVLVMKRKETWVLLRIVHFYFTTLRSEKNTMGCRLPSLCLESPLWRFH